MAASLGQLLVDDLLPKEYRGRGRLTKAKLHEILVDLARHKPTEYPEVVTGLKRLGDELATQEGISVGLDDIAPDYRTRDDLLRPFENAFNTASGDEREKVLLRAQNAMVDYAKAHPGTMGDMVRSGGRGSAGQLLKIVGAPVLARNEHDQILPWLLKRSYSEGLTPADAWVAGNEARINAIKSNISVVEPGDLAKILVNNMHDQLITTPDCGTTNGVVMDAKDPHVIDRYLAHAVATPPVAAGTLITPQLAQHLSGTIVVRSPMTCQAAHGICQKCQGLDPSGKLHLIGTNVGVRAAQAMSEPLTQFSLNAKHGGRIDTGKDRGKSLEGIKGVRQMLEIPRSFLHKATLAEHDGQVARIEEAPQGGRYVWIGETRHYAPPDLGVTVNVGQKVEAGDKLSDGVPKPDEVVRHKGLGEGRRYLVDTLHAIYKNAGADIDKRHVETLAKSVLNHVYVADTDDEHDHGFLKGDVIDYNRLQAELVKDARELPVDDAIGELLAQNTLHFTAGTRVTASVRDALRRQGIMNVRTAAHPPQLEPLMRPASRTPLLNPDWMARLAHRYLGESLLAGAHRGDKSELHGYSPIPAYAAGSEFGQGDEGRY
jgi:DNA-directed RNA polymerase subunit beta'